MHVGRKAYFRSERDAVSWKCDAIRLLEGNLDMRRFDGIRNFISQFRKEFCNQVVSRNPFPVLGLEKFFVDYTATIDEKISRTGHVQELSGRLGIQHLVSTNGRGIWIGQEREIDFAAVGERFQDRFAVV